MRWNWGKTRTWILHIIVGNTYRQPFFLIIIMMNLWTCYILISYSNIFQSFQTIAYHDIITNVFYILSLLNLYSFFLYSMANSGIGKMHLDLYTQNSGLTHKAKFWCNYVSALKGELWQQNLIYLDNLLSPSL